MMKKTPLEIEYKLTVTCINITLVNTNTTLSLQSVKREK